MAKNTIADLRDHLFEVMEALKDKDDPMDIARAQAVVSVSQAIIGTAKAEIDLVRAVNAVGPGSRGFFNLPPAAAEETRQLPEGATRLTRLLEQEDRADRFALRGRSPSELPKS